MPRRNKNAQGAETGAEDFVEQQAERIRRFQDEQAERIRRATGYDPEKGWR